MGDTIWTIIRTVNWTTQYFSEKGIDSPRLNAEVLLAYALKTDRLDLYLNHDKPLTKNERKNYKELIRRRIKREPLQYITGRQEFYSLNFEVSKGVLIPRPETEILVEEALKIFSPQNYRDTAVHILDLATGSGVIAITLATELQQAVILATDISDAALRVARKNAEVHKVDKQITFLKGDLFCPVKDRREHFNLVISNPPYIPAAEFKDLQPEVRDFEPRIALDGSEEGLCFYRRILSEVARYLSKDGWLMLEVGKDQADRVCEIVESTRDFFLPSITKDLSGIERVIKAQKNG